LHLFDKRRMYADMSGETLIARRDRVRVVLAARSHPLLLAAGGDL
jgi:hypothetical protein